MNEVPFFYFPSLKDATGAVNMDDEMRRHVVTVLRMEVGEKIMLMDGKGTVAEASIEEANKKNLRVQLGNKIFHPAPETKTILAISLLKNPSRFEWMLEKVTEIGITDIIPLIAERTERIHFRMERMQQILVSASIQSKQYWMPTLHSPQKLKDFVEGAKYNHKFIAHCIDDKKNLLVKQEEDALLLVGPEGDFTATEISHAVEHGFIAVTLGESRLRTETAGVVGAVLLKI
jgi:16S rRNA (uracil1498-N3)-methyltransferase